MTGGSRRMVSEQTTNPDDPASTSPLSREHICFREAVVDIAVCLGPWR